MVKEKTEITVVDDKEQGIDALLSFIQRAASDPNVDVDKMERLFSMREREMDRNAEMSFNSAMSAAQGEMPQVFRNRKNEHTKSRYAELSHISKMIDPISHKYGFALSFGTEISDREHHYRVTCIVSHSAGHSRNYQMDVPEDTHGTGGKRVKTDVQGMGASNSYGRRYLKTMIFDISLTNEDNDGNPPVDNSTITKEQAEIIEKGLTDTNSDKTRFLAAFAVKEVSELPRSRFDQAVSLIDKKRASK